jgi:hypothetical protein
MPRLVQNSTWRGMEQYVSRQGHGNGHVQESLESKLKRREYQPRESLAHL